ncbi:hypothetical protein ACOYR1_10740 [Thalassotalea piscium]
MLNNLIFVIMCTFLVGIVSCSKDKKATVERIEPQCLASQSACQITTSFGKLSVLFDQKAIIPEQEFTLFVGNKSLEQGFNITGFIEGKSMYMGKIPLFFSSEKVNGFKTAQTMLGSCTDKKMIWSLQLTLVPTSETANNQPESFSIEFTSIRD